MLGNRQKCPLSSDKTLIVRRTSLSSRPPRPISDTLSQETNAPQNRTITMCDLEIKHTRKGRTIQYHRMSDEDAHVKICSWIRKVQHYRGFYYLQHNAILLLNLFVGFVFFSAVLSRRGPLGWTVWLQNKFKIKSQIV